MASNNVVLHLSDLTDFVGKGDTGKEKCDVDTLNEKHAVVSMGGKTRVLNERNGQITFSSVHDFHNFYQHKRTPDGEPISHIWMKHPDRRTYESVVFIPNTEVDDDSYNLWRGFAVEPDPTGNCSLYLEHIKDNIADGNDDLYNYILDWTADAVQNTATRPGVAIVLRGKRGTGKGQFVKHFGALFGEHFIQVTQPKQLVGNFNAHLSKALFVHADEAYWGGNRQDEKWTPIFGQPFKCNLPTQPVA